MKLSEHLSRNLDYNNSFQLKKMISKLEYEFNMAVRWKNQNYANEILYATKEIYDEFSSTYRESEGYGETMSYMQKVYAIRFRDFINYLTKRLNNEF